MAKLIEYDVTDVEESTGGTGVKVKPGVYPARIAKCVQRTEKRNGEPANDIEVALDLGEEYDWVFTYIGLSKAADWKLKEFISALGLKDKGKLDPEKMVDKIIRVKINPGSYEGEYSPNAGRLMKANKGDVIGEKVSATAAAAANGSEPEPDDDDSPLADTETGEQLFWREGQPDPENPDETVASYDDWEDEDLLAEVEDRNLALPAGRGAKRAKAITALRADDAESSGADDDEGGNVAADGENYDDWTTDDLVTEYESRGFDEDTPTFKGRNAEQRQRAAIIKALTEDDNEDPFKA